VNYENSVKDDFKASAKRENQPYATGVDMHTVLFPMNVLVQCVGIKIENFQPGVMDHIFLPCAAIHIYIYIYINIYP